MIGIATIFMLVFGVIATIGISMFLVAVVNVLSIVALVILFPLLFKILYDYFLTYKLKISRWVGMISALIGAIFIEVFLYMNMFWLLFGGIIIVAVYVYISRKLPTSAKVGGMWDDFRDWFGGKK